MQPGRAVFFVSDGTGITAETLGKGLLSQFNGINFRQLRFPFVDSPEKASDCQLRIREAREQDGVRPLVAMTIMGPENQCNAASRGCSVSRSV